MEYYIDFFSDSNISYIFMSGFTTFCNFSFFLLNLNTINYNKKLTDLKLSQTFEHLPFCLNKKFHDDPAKWISDSTDDPSDFETGVIVTSDGKDYLTSNEVILGEKDYVMTDRKDDVMPDGKDDLMTEGKNSFVDKSTEYSSVCSTIFCSRFEKSDRFSGAEGDRFSGAEGDRFSGAEGETQLSDLYSNSSFYSIDSEDEKKIKKIKSKMKSLKSKIKKIKLNALKRSNLTMLCSR
jgi:hypothetical protein